MAQQFQAKPTSSKELIRAHRVFNRKWFAGIQATRKATHALLDKAKSDYQKRYDKLYKDFKAEAVKAAGLADAVVDGAICSNIMCYNSGFPILATHEALSLVRSPELGNFEMEDPSDKDWLGLYEMALDREFVSPSTAEITKHEDHLEELLHIQRQGKHGEKPTSMVEDNTIPEHLKDSVSDGSSTGFKRKPVHAPMGRRQAEQLMKDSSRDISGEAGSQDLSKATNTPSEMAMMEYRNSGVIPTGYRLHTGENGQTLELI